jgi:mannose-1-phosphate guanylyltransferase
MRPVVYRRRADNLPKQYVNFIGKRSMLEHTFQRVEKLIPAHEFLVIIAKEHLQFDEVRRQIAWRPRECIVIQPENKDTAPGVLLPLLHLYKRYPDALVAVFPSDHFILEEDLFMQHVDRAFRIVESNGSRIVLLGMKPNEPDPEYGYIVPGAKIDDSGMDEGRKVEMFVEKPSTEAAKTIIRQGALWNTLVLVVRCNTLLEAIQRAAPELYSSFEPIQNAIGTPDEQRVFEQVYQKLPSLNFSTGILEVLSFKHRQALVVLPVSGVSWSDWGTSDRLSGMLRRVGQSDYAPPGHLPSETKSATGFLSKFGNP